VLVAGHASLHRRFPATFVRVRAGAQIKGRLRSMSAPIDVPEVSSAGPFTPALGQVDGGKPPQKQRSRECRLLAIVGIIVVSWLVVKIWADVFELFVRKVLKIDKDRFVANLVVAIGFTLVIVWLLYVASVDDMLSA
jgi:hypothetical protein